MNVDQIKLSRLNGHPDFGVAGWAEERVIFSVGWKKLARPKK